jgi:hypothetical protein
MELVVLVNNRFGTLNDFNNLSNITKLRPIVAGIHLTDVRMDKYLNWLKSILTSDINKLIIAENDKGIMSWIVIQAYPKLQRYIITGRRTNPNNVPAKFHYSNNGLKQCIEFGTDYAKMLGLEKCYIGMTSKICRQEMLVRKISCPDIFKNKQTVEEIIPKMTRSENEFHRIVVSNAIFKDEVIILSYDL